MAGRREVKVAVVGDAAQLKRELDKAEAQLSGFGASATKTATKFNKEFLALGVGIGAAFAIAGKTAMDFDAELSNVAAVSGATADEMKKLRQAALDAGQATVFGASDAAKAQSELAKAGVSTADILSGGLTGALDLAAAGNIDLATAATYAANAMTTFKLSGEDVPRIADALAAGANKSAADVGDMGLALQQAGLVASQTGLDLEETVGVLSLFAQAGLRGSDAGTSLKTALMRLTPSTKEAALEMQALGLNFYDAQGRFVGISDAAKQLKDKLGPLSAEQRNMALQTIFGTDAIRAATVLMDAGSSGVEEWTDAVSESGYASELAAKKTDNLKGDLEKLRGSLETALIQGGSQATTVLRGLTSGITDMVNGIGAMPAPIQTAFLGATGLIGVGSAAIGIYGTLQPKIEAFKRALEGMGNIGPKVAGSLGTIGVAAGGVTVGLGLIAAAMGKQADIQAQFNARVDEFVAAMKEAGGATDDFNNSIRKAFVDSKIGPILADSNADLDIFSQGVRDSGTALDDLARYFQDATGVSGDFETALRLTAEAGDPLAQELVRLRKEGQISAVELQTLVLGLDGMNDAVDTGAEKLDVENQLLGGLTEGTTSAAGGTTALADANLEAARNAEAHTKAINEQITAMMGLAGGELGLQGAQIASRKELVAYNEAMKNNLLSANDREQAGVDLLEAYIREAAAAASLAEDQAKAAGGSLDAAEAARIQRERLETLRDTLAPSSPLRAQLQGYIDKLYEIPKDVTTTIKVDDAEARQKVRDLSTQLGIFTSQSYVIPLGIAAGGTEYVTGLDGKLHAKAMGGPVDAGKPYLVGERGPELFWPNSYGKVMNTGDSARALAPQAAGKGDVFNIYGPDPRATAWEVVRQRRKQAYLAGGR